MKNFYLFFLILVFQTTLTMEKSSPDTSSLTTSRQKISTIIQDNPTLTPKKIATFLRVKEILTITREIGKKLHEDYGSVLQDGPSTWPQLNYSPQCRTKNGIFLSCGLYPRSLATPWGLVKIYGNACFYDGTEYLPTQILFQRLGVSFIQCSKDQEDVYEVFPQIFERKESPKKKSFSASLKKLDAQTLAATVGSNKIIIASTNKRISNLFKEVLDPYDLGSDFCEGDSVYQVTTIDGQPCPKAVNLTNSEKEKLSVEEDWEKAKEEWEKLEELYSQKRLG